jgi:hypothetical protein
MVSRKKQQEIKEFFQRHFPDISLPTIWRINEKLSSHTGIRPVWYDCCINSCMAFTGDATNDAHCTALKDKPKPTGRRCNARYFEGTVKPRKRWLYIPLLPRLIRQFKSEQADVLSEYRASFDDPTPGRDFCDIFNGQ